MPNHGKGGRPTERGEVKRAAIAVRTTPTIKAALDAAAEEAGRSTTQEIEARLEASLAMDRPKRTPETMLLLADLAADIARAEELTGKRWHKDLRTWAMVREALASGWIEARCPELDRFHTDVDGDIADLRETMQQKWREIAAEGAVLRRLGVEPPTDPDYMLNPTEEPLGSQLDSIEDGAVRDLAGEAIDNFVSLNREWQEALESYSLNMTENYTAIAEGVVQWEQDLRQRGRYIAREYRPGFVSSYATSRTNALAPLSVSAALKALRGGPSERNDRRAIPAGDTV